MHERDGLTDFLLTKIRDVLHKIPTLKVILSSAALDIDLFLQYFGSSPVIHRMSYELIKVINIYAIWYYFSSLLVFNFVGFPVTVWLAVMQNFDKSETKLKIYWVPVLAG